MSCGNIKSNKDNEKKFSLRNCTKAAIMIPTSATSSSPPTACMGSMGDYISNSSAIPCSANTGNGASGSGVVGGQVINSAFLGIASLILEGRALADDEYAIQTSRNELKTSLSGNSAECGRQSPKPSTSRAAFAETFGSAVSSSANSSFSIDLANYLGRKSSNSPESMSSSFLRDSYSSSGESASSSVDSNHSRWSQKLSQLRQESPNAHQVLAARQKVAIECARGSDAEYVALAINTDHHGSNEERRGGDFEILKRMSINQMNFYNSPNSMGGGGGGVGGCGSSDVGSGGSTENFMCSLQSLASNTCLRVGSPLLVNTTSPPRYSNNRQTTANASRFSTPPHQKLDFSTESPSSSGSSSGVCANSCYTASSPNSNNKDYLLRKVTTTTTQRMAISAPQTANNKVINPSTFSHKLHPNFLSRNSSVNSVTATTITSSSPVTATASRNQSYPQQGPHCDQFLRKMGLAKGDGSEAEEHHCDMSYVNITCTRWRAYCNKMENILDSGEPICIEVYLGPVGHKVLLEQWIITQNEKQPPPTMTLPSLCSAIRSQLYFSQISAWCDLIKKSDKTIYETGRVIFTTTPTTSTSAAGDLATTTATTNNAMTTAQSATTITTSQQQQHTTGMLPLAPSSSSTSPMGGSGGGVGGVVGCVKRRSSAPRLNIFYRIKQYDSTACFNSKPNVHNFPNVNISENCSVSVCLKSLPRITGGIPKVGTTATTTTTNTQQHQHISPTSGLTSTATAIETPPVNSAAAKYKATTAAETVKTEAAVAVTAAAATTITTNANKSKILIMNCDNYNLKEHQHQQQKPLTASSHCSINGKNSKSSSVEQEHDHNHHQDQDQDVDFECDEQNIDLSAGGDSSILSCGGASVGDCDSSNSSFSTNNYGNLSHREKQLLKYRKRMLKRDKKQQLRKANENVCKNQIQKPLHRDNSSCNKMEQGEDEDNNDEADDVEQHDDGNNSSDTTADYYSERNHYRSVNRLIGKGQRQQLPNNRINSIPLTTIQQLQQQQQQHHVKMISTGTQTISNACIACGAEKSMICLKCNPLKATHAANDDVKPITDSLYSYEEVMDAETSSSSSASSLSSSDIIHTPRNKAELLLQAIQRTPKSNKKHKHKSKDSNQMAAINQQQQSPHTTNNTSTIINSNNNHRNSNNNSNITNGGNSSHDISSSSSNNSVLNGIVANNSSIGSNISVVGCQMCKRQKTQHHFNQPSSGEELSTEDNRTLANSSGTINATAKNAIQNVSSTDVGGGGSGSGDVAEDDDDCDNEKDGGKTLSADCVDNVSIVIDDDDDGDDDGDSEHFKMSSAKSCDNLNENEIMEEEYFVTSTKLTPHIDCCFLDTKVPCSQITKPSANGTDRIEYRESFCSTPPLEEQTKNHSSSEGPVMMAQFKTPTLSEQQQNAMKSKTQQPLQPHKHTPKPNLLHIACNFNKNEEQQISKFQHISSSSSMDNNTPTTHNPLLLRRSLPKVNLTPIFCNPKSMVVVSSSPITIGNGVCNGSTNGLTPKTSNSADINITEASPAFSFESPSSPLPSLMVQKSNSAPTLPNSHSLSPRFVKASAIYKRRSRHLSDRSDRSSLGSDEQLSDEDIDSGMYSPFSASPVKLRTRLSALFGRKPLLGNLEECLLQRRLVPKTEVMGFKLLLGASGGFCPTQLTIPAAAYFYELKGETLSTPYLCEIRLPRKGYTVPRCGTVQATLLNPMGTVVRMFVIPYDMRDMPTLHQTFIRQRILADTGMQSKNDFQRNSGVDGKHFNNVVVNATATTTTINAERQTMQQHHHQQVEQHSPLGQQQQRSPTQCNNENPLGHFISAENMKSLRYSIHLRFQTSRTGRLMLHTDIRLLISRRTDCDTAAAHAKGVLEAPNELITNTVMPTNPKYSARQDQTTSKI